MRKLKEQVDYGDRPERMDPRLERKLSDPEGLYAQNPALRRGVSDVQRLVSSRFNKVADKLKQVTGIDDISPSHVKSMLTSEMMLKASQVMRMEANIKPQLKQIAIDACLEETEADPSWYIIEPYLNESPIDLSNFRMEPPSEEEFKKKDDEEDGEEQSDEEQSGEFQLPEIDELTPEEEFELEKHKRNIINALIQGAAKKGHYVFQKPEVKSKLDRLNPRLYENYLAIMAINDFLYFSMEQMIEMMSTTGQGVAGKVELDTPDEEDIQNYEEENPGEEAPDTKIVANGAFFPILCHEIIKGIEEAPSRHGLPSEKSMREKVVAYTDTLYNEPDQLRIGPEIHEMLRFALPDEMFETKNKGLIYWFKIELYKLPAKEFLSIIGDVISQDETKNKRATKRFEQIMRDAQALKQEYDDFKNQQGETSDDNPEDDDDIDDFFRSLGIDRPE